MLFFGIECFVQSERGSICQPYIVNAIALSDYDDDEQIISVVFNH